MLGPSGAFSQQQKPKGTADAIPSAYLLVIDHSGSMTEKLDNGKTRWQEMQERATEFLKTIPLKSRVWIAIFDDPDRPLKDPDKRFDTEADRNAAIEWIRRYEDPEKGGTAYYDTLGLAFTQARVLRRQSSLMYVTIIAYTDGKFDKTDGKNEHSKVFHSWEELRRAFPEVTKKGERLWVCEVRPGRDGAIPDPVTPVAIRLSPVSVLLANPRIRPQQTISLNFTCLREGDQPHVGQPLRFEVTPTGNLKAQVQGEYTLVNGKLDVTLVVTNPNDLSPDREYAAILKVIYPKIGRLVVAPEGGDEVSISFSREEKPALLALVPEDGSTRIAKTPIRFSVTTLQEASVEWDFGDRTAKGTGREVTHAYDTAGTYEVTVKATILIPGPAGKAVEITNTARLRIRILSIAVMIHDSPKPMVVGEGYAFACTGEGPIERYEWTIDGLPCGSSPVPGQSNTSVANSYVFNSEGQHRITVSGVAQDAAIVAEAWVTVDPKPDIRISKPSDGATVFFGDSLPLLFDVVGPVQGVHVKVTRILANQQRESLFEGQVKRLGDEKTLALECPAFAETCFQMPVTIVAEGAILPQLKMKPPSHSVSITLKAPDREIRIFDPPDGTHLEFRSDYVFQAECRGAVKDVRWKVRASKEGQTDGDWIHQPKDPVQVQEVDGRAIARTPGVPLKEDASSKTVVATATVVLPPTVEDDSQYPKQKLESQMEYVVVPPARHIRIVEPEAAQDLRQGEKILCEAEVKGKGIVEVKWSATEIQTAKRLAPSESESEIRGVKDGRSVWTWQCPWSETEEDLRVAIHATTILDGGFQGNAVSDKIERTIRYGTPLKVTPLGTPPYSIRQAVTFQLASSIELKFIAWNFGDGSPVDDESNSASVTHEYVRGGTFPVTAIVTLRDGRAVRSLASVLVQIIPPRAIPQILSKGRPVSWVWCGTGIELGDSSTGDIESRIWKLNGEPLPEHARTVVLSETGKHVFTLHVESPPEMDGRIHASEATIEVPVLKFRWWLILVLVVSSVAIILFDCRFFLHNHARAWRLYHGKTPEENIMLSKRVGKFWSRCAKRADIPMKNLFPASEYWTKGPGSKEAIVVRTLGRRKGIWYGNASFTGELDPDVTFELVRESERTKDYELTVGRAPREEPFRQVYFRLLMEARLPRFDYFVFLLILTVLLGAICIAGTMFSVVL